MAKTNNLNLETDFLGLGLHADSLKANFEGLADAVGEVLAGSKTHDFANVVDGARASTTVTVTDAALGDHVTSVSLSIDAAGGLLHGYVSAADTVTVVLLNETGADLNLASATLRVLVRKA